jgi:hypothetical protein
VPWRTEIEKGVNHFVTAYAQQGCSKDKLGFVINEDFHEALRFALFERAAHLFHGHFCNESRPSGGSDFGFGHACPAQWRIDVEILGSDTVRHAALLMTEQIGCDNLEIIVGRMGERATAVAIPESPNASHVGSETIIHLNIAAGIGCDSGLVQS